MTHVGGRHDQEHSRAGDRAFETKLNIYLSKILNQELGLQSISETRKGKDRPDILIFVGGLKILIEGSYSKQDAINDVKTKIEKGFADIGIALHYKGDIPDDVESEVIEQLKKSKFDFRLFKAKDLSNTLIPFVSANNKQKTTVPESDWSEIDVIGLASYIRSDIYDVLVKEELVGKTVQEIEEATKDFAHQLRGIDKNLKMAEKLYSVFYQLYGLHVGDHKLIAGLIYAKSFLAMLLSVAFYQSVQPHFSELSSLNNLIGKFGNKEGITRAFRTIRKIDYQPIYDVTLQVVEALPSEVFDAPISLGSKLGSNHTLLKRDFSGKIYHRVVGDANLRKGFATYFTTIPASYLLSYLSVFSTYKPLSNAESIRVCDLTCGSGTLLTAAYSALEDLYKIEKFEEGEINLDAFHKKVLEDNIWGLDALRYALQIASLNLVFHNPSISLKKMNFYSIPLGKSDKSGKGGIELGSLRYIRTGTLPDYFSVNDTAEQTSAIDNKQTDNGNSSSSDGITLPSDFDLIIMNPPFTRATGREGKKGGGLFGFIVNDDIRESVLSEYEKIRRSVNESLERIGSKYLEEFKGGSFGGIGQAGEGALFLYLAFQHLNNNSGRIAFVLPKSVLSGASWFLIRTLLLEKFHLEYVVVSYDKEHGYNFSESTDLSECLIIARKTEPSIEHLTKFVMLLKKPVTSFEAIALAKSILKRNNDGGGIVETDNAFASTYEVLRNELKENIDNWGRFVSFPSVRMLRIINDLNRGKLFGAKIPVAKLGDISTMGIDAHQFHDICRVTNKEVSGRRAILYGGEEDNRTYMRGKYNAYVIAKDQKADEAFERIFKEKSSYLLVPDRIRLNTAHIISMMIPTRVLSNIFYAVKLDRSESDSRYKAICVWINSTFGLLSILANRQETEGAWIRLKMSHWRLQTVLDVTKLSEKTINKLAEIFDKYGAKKMKRIPQQYDYNNNNVDETRMNLDREVLEALGIKISNEKLNELYRVIYESFDQWFKVDKAEVEIKGLKQEVLDST